VTTLVSAAGADTVEAGRRPSGLARLAWVTWRQHRAALIGLAVFVAVMAAYAVVYGLAMRGVTTYRCVGPGSARVPCQILFEANYAAWLSGFLVPVVIGMFVGAPLLAREYSTATNRFAWTQSAGRTWPTLAKLILLGLAVLAAGALSGALAQWADVAPDSQSSMVFSGWIPDIFASAPVTEAAAALLCYALGVLAGVLTRRVVPAMAATAAAFTALAQLGYGRLYYWMLGFGVRRASYPGLGASQLTGRAASRHAPGGRFGLHQAVGPTVYGPGPAVRWLDQGWYADAHGHPLRGAALLRVIQHPWRLTQLHDTFWVTYQPANRFWLFQSVLGGAELLLALLLGALALWLVRRRNA
jgi:hypothetical protein